MSHYLLEQSVTGQPTPFTSFFYPKGMFEDTQTTLNVLVTLEDAFIAAYLVGVRDFSTRDLRVTAARIMGIESDHRTLARDWSGRCGQDGGPINTALPDYVTWRKQRRPTTTATNAVLDENRTNRRCAHALQCWTSPPRKRRVDVVEVVQLRPVCSKPADRREHLFLLSPVVSFETGRAGEVIVVDEPPAANQRMLARKSKCSQPNH